jgi:hypothetical protein
MKIYILTPLLLLLSFSVYSDVIDELIITNCNENIPVNIIKKLITHESKSIFNKKIQPWPWVLNVNGKSHYFKNREKVTNAALFFIANKSNIVDLGLGQINWKYHHHRFDGDVKKAIDPSINIAVVCEILAEGLSDNRVTNWLDMVAYYHRTVLDERAYLYAEKVFSN